MRTKSTIAETVGWQTSSLHFEAPLVERTSYSLE